MQGHRYALVVFGALLAMVAGANALRLVSVSVPFEHALSLSDPSSRAQNLPSVIAIMTGGSLLIGVVRRTLPDSTTWIEVSGWIAVGTAFVTYGLVDAANERGALDMLASWAASAAPWGIGHAGPGLLSFAQALIIVMALSFVAALFWKMRAIPSARRWILVGSLCACVNPPTGAIKTKLTSDPNNYTFVSNDQPYRFNANASRTLDEVIVVQELSESAAMLSFFVVVLSLRRPVRISTDARDLGGQGGRDRAPARNHEPPMISEEIDMRSFTHRDRAYGMRHEQ